MTSEKTNQQALAFLNEQRWKDAQKLFFENAKENPSHQTYNNLGFYLITEGLTLKNGKTRNAWKLGFKYLLRAESYRASLTNAAAITKAIELRLLHTNEDKTSLFRAACEHLENARELDFTHTLGYNYLRYRYLLNPRDERLLSDVRNFVQKRPFAESVILFFCLLKANGMVEDCLKCISDYADKYSAFFDEAELIMFYAQYGFYEYGYNLCKPLCEKYDINKFLASAIIECCLNTNHFNEAITYANKIQEDKACSEKENWCAKVFCNLSDSSSYRKELINSYSYHFWPPFVELCGYFGCTSHGNKWI